MSWTDVDQLFGAPVTVTGLTNDVSFTKANPAVILTGTEANFQWTEVREVAGSLWFAKNASFATGAWLQQDLTKASYAIQYDSTGNAKFLTAPLGTQAIVWTQVASITNAGNVTSPKLGDGGDVMTNGQTAAFAVGTRGTAYNARVLLWGINGGTATGTLAGAASDVVSGVTGTMAEFASVGVMATHTFDATGNVGVAGYVAVASGVNGGHRVSGAAGFYSGSGVPSFSAPSGSLYSRFDGSANNRLYINTSTASTSGTSWAAVTTP